MSSHRLPEFYAKLEKLREFDSLIDFSKSRLQLDIVLLLASSQEPLSIDEIVRSLGQRKKPILDAMRKLELKGIVRRVDDREKIYELSELGRQLIEDLLTILTAGNLKEVLREYRRYGKVAARDLTKLLIPVSYLYEVLVALGTARKNELSLNALSRITGISGQRLMVYLDPYSDPKSETRLLKKVRRETISTKIRNILFSTKRTEVFYRLTNLGLETFYRLPMYVKFKNNPIAVKLSRIFGSWSPRYVLYRLSLINIILGSILTAAMLLAPNIAIIATIIWILMSLLLSTLLLVAYK